MEKSAILICGSLAYDYILLFPGRFQDHILPEKIHILNVSFLSPKMRRQFGGCAGNIAYSLNLLSGQCPQIMATVGHDFTDYGTWMAEHGIDQQQYIRVIEDEFTAQAFITTDLNNNQITAFHPGAMSYAETNKIPIDSAFCLAIIAPDDKQGMLEHATQLAKANIPFIFDPGQGLPMFNRDELLRFVEQANWMIVNDYELQMFQNTTKLTVADLRQAFEAVIVTHGEDGSHIYLKNETYEVLAITPRCVNDPTGCGDAYRAGLLYGLHNKLEWQEIGRIASLLASYKIEHYGGQNHYFTLDEFTQRYAQVFASPSRI